MTLVTVLITVVLMAIVMLLLGIGVMFRGRCLRGTCGGEGVIGPNGEVLTCDTCPNREKIEREAQRLREEEAEKAKPSMTSR